MKITLMLEPGQQREIESFWELPIDLPAVPRIGDGIDLVGIQYGDRVIEVYARVRDVVWHPDADPQCWVNAYITDAEDAETGMPILELADRK